MTASSPPESREVEAALFRLETPVAAEREGLAPAVLEHIMCYRAQKIPIVCHECEGRGKKIRFITRNPKSYERPDNVLLHISLWETCTGCEGSGIRWMEP